MILFFQYRTTAILSAKFTRRIISFKDATKTMNATNATLCSFTDVIDASSHYRMFLFAYYYRLVVFSFAVDTVLVGLLCIVGFVGNLLSIVVLRKDRRIKSSTSFILRCLAVADTSLLMDCLVYLTVRPIYPYTGHLRRFYEFHPYLVPYLWALAMTAQTTTNWFVVLLTVERYIVVCHPLKAARWCTLFNTKVAIATICLLACLYNVPRYFEWEVAVTEDVCSDFVLANAQDGPLRASSLYNIAYRLVSYVIFVSFCPVAIVVVLNVRSVCTLRRARRARGPMSATGQSHITTTRIIVVVVVVFIVCQTPAMVHQILLSLDIELNAVTLAYSVIVSNMLVALNSSINFLIYCLFGRRFRAILYDTFAQGETIGLLVAYVSRHFSRGEVEVEAEEQAVESRDQSGLEVNYGQTGAEWTSEVNNQPTMTEN